MGSDVELPVEAPGNAGGRSAGQPRNAFRWFVVVTLAMFAVVISAVARSSNYRSGFDIAILETRVRDAAHSVIAVGPYSRFKWYHPGPAIYYLLLLPYKLLGSRGIGLHVGALLSNLSALIGLLVLGRRTGSRRLMISIILPVFLLVRNIAPSVLGSPWNPELPLMWLMLLLVACWLVACGDLRLAPLIVALASIIVQTHVGFLLVVSVFVAIAFFMGLKYPLARYHRCGGRTWVVSGALFVFAWSPIAYGLVVLGDRNVFQLASFFVHGSADPSPNWAYSFRVVATELSLLPSWIAGGNHAFARTTSLIAVIPVTALIVVALRWANRTRDQIAQRLAILLFAGFGAAVVSVRAVVGPLWFYLIRWIEILGCGLGILLCYVASGMLSDRLQRLRPLGSQRIRRLLCNLAIGSVVAIAVFVTSGLWQRSLPADSIGIPAATQQRALETLDQQIFSHLRSRPKTLLATIHPSAVYDAPAIIALLDHAGIRAEIDGKDMSIPYGSERRSRCHQYAVGLTFVSGHQYVKIETNSGPRIADWTLDFPQIDRYRQRMAMFAALRKPPSPDRSHQIDKVQALLDGPKLEVAVFAREHVYPADCKRK